MLMIMTHCQLWKIYGGHANSQPLNDGWSNGERRLIHDLVTLPENEFAANALPFFVYLITTGVGALARQLGIPIIVVFEIKLFKLLAPAFIVAIAGALVAIGFKSARFVKIPAASKSIWNFKYR